MPTLYAATLAKPRRIGEGIPGEKRLALNRRDRAIHHFDARGEIAQIIKRR